jgi:2-keto-4-pentenoate hydratase/2-oxohepta-3-ene-1,7-dioic acid hydratase in catechol pathway
MKIVQYQLPDGSVHTGELVGETIYALNKTVSEIMDGGIALRGQPVSNGKLVAPLLPNQIFCIGKNYADHIAEMKSTTPSAPLIFAKFQNTIVGQGDTVSWSTALTQQVDWEGELVVVIGRKTSRITESDAYDHIFGYTIANDISARDIQNAESQWLRAKSTDTFCPLGPCIITRDEIADPHALTIITTVNGETVQNASTGLMLRNIPYLIAYLSQTFTLNPGDLILTGTPSGVGAGMNPPRFLNNGDSVSVTIDPIGTLTNPCATWA